MTSCYDDEANDGDDGNDNNNDDEAENDDLNVTDVNDDDDGDDLQLFPAGKSIFEERSNSLYRWNRPNRLNRLNQFKLVSAKKVNCELENVCL